MTSGYAHCYPVEDEKPLFRGQPDVSLKLLPSIARDRESAVSVSILNEERNLVEIAKIQEPTIFTNDLKPVDLLASLQHHGIPTRLLDVTENALVALYFACCDEKCDDKDGEVIVFKDTQTKIGNYPIIQAIADTYRLFGIAEESAKSFFRIAENMDYFAEQKYLLKLLDRDNDTYPKFESDYDNWLWEITRKPIFIYAPFRHLRQRIQQGRYILFPNDVGCFGKSVAFKTMISPISKNNACIAARIQIDSKSKKKILRELRLFGVSRQTLFADSVDIVCGEITKDAYSRLQDE